MQNIFDTHAHYDSDAFNSDRDELLKSLPALGVCGVVTCGANLEGSRSAIALAAQYPYIYAAAGVHPEDIKDAPPDWLEQLEALLSAGKVVALGEIGLDYYWKENAPREVQQTAFEAQLELAKKKSLPVIVHDREAHGDTVEILQRHRPKGVLHCFSGSVEMARQVLELGMYIGLGGAVTFKNARVPVEVAAMVPADHLLLETDCPYMTPVPFRGKRNDSSLIAHTATRIAEIRGVDVDELLSQTRANAETFFSLPG